MAELSDEHKAALLRLFGVKCRQCKGTGTEPDYVGLEMACVGVTCTRCDGTGHHLSGATRETWPWGFTRSCPYCADSTHDHVCDDEWVPIFPRPDDAQAAVKAWLRIAQSTPIDHIEVCLTPHGVYLVDWGPATKPGDVFGDLSGDTLLLALLSALVEAQR